MRPGVLWCIAVPEYGKNRRLWSWYPHHLKSFWLQANEMSLWKGRVGSYIGLSVLLLAAFIFLREISWEGSTTLHTSMEIVATLLSLFVGIIALILYYTKKNNTKTDLIRAVRVFHQRNRRFGGLQETTGMVAAVG